jgi:hypothetical protein
MFQPQLTALLERAAREFLPVDLEQQLLAVLDEYFAARRPVRLTQRPYVCRACQRASVAQDFAELADLIVHRWSDCRAATDEREYAAALRLLLRDKTVLPPTLTLVRSSEAA